jgi:nucleoid-associated protein YgaU
LEPNASVTIQETIKAGRIVEARTLLTLHESILSEEERSALDQEIDRLYDEANALIVKAEAMENEGRAEEAKALYEAASIFAADFPGIQGHIKRIEETLFLTRAVKRRNQRIRESIPPGQRVPHKKQFPRPLGAILTTGIIALILFLFFLKNQFPGSAPKKTEQETSVQIAPVQPISAPEKALSLEPTETKVEQPVVSEPVNQPKVKEPQVAASIPVQPTSTATQTAESSQNNEKKQNEEERYTVQRGDSLSLIAERMFCYRDAWKKIHELNKKQVVDPNQLHPGMVLELKGIKSHCRSTL